MPLHVGAALFQVSYYGKQRSCWPLENEQQQTQLLQQKNVEKLL